MKTANAGQITRSSSTGASGLFMGAGAPNFSFGLFSVPALGVETARAQGFIQDSLMTCPRGPGNGCPDVRGLANDHPSIEMDSKRMNSPATKDRLPPNGFGRILGVPCARLKRSKRRKARKRNLGVAGKNETPTKLPDPTPVLPGESRVDVLMRRAEAGELLWHPLDNKGDD
jgi:hypothetical protein